MIAFEIYLNGERLCAAGIGDLGVLSTILTWSRVHTEGRESDQPKERLTLNVAGLDNSERYPKWLDRGVARGDEIRIRIVEATCVDQPLEQKRMKRSDPEEDAKKYVRTMATEWGWRIKE